MHKLKFLLSTLVEQSKSNQMQIDLYTELYDELLKLFLHFGSAIKIAFADISEKAEQIRNGKKTVSQAYHLDQGQPGSQEYAADKYVEQLILWEVQEELVMMNGDNNKKVMASRKLSNIRISDYSWMKSYISVGWVVVRGAWFMDFLEATLYCLSFKKDMQCSDVAVYSYDTALARHHPWFLQKGAKLGMRLACSRPTFIKNLCDEQTKVTGRPYTAAMAEQDFEELYAYVKHMSQHLWNFFKGLGLEEIP